MQNEMSMCKDIPQILFFSTVGVLTCKVSIAPYISLTASTAPAPEPVPAARIDRTQCTHTCLLALLVQPMLGPL